MMNQETMRMATLESRLRAERSAAGFRQQLTPELDRIVRRALRPGTASSVLTERIRALAKREDRPGGLEGAVAERICDRLAAHGADFDAGVALNRTVRV